MRLRAPEGDPARDGLFASPREATILASLMLVVGTLLVYQRALHNAFVSYDDPDSSRIIPWFARAFPGARLRGHSGPRPRITGIRSHGFRT